MDTPFSFLFICWSSSLFYDVIIKGKYNDKEGSFIMEDSRMNRDEIKSILDGLGMDRKEFMVIASGALVLRGIWDGAADIDLTVTEKGLEEMRRTHEVREPEPGHFEVGERVEFRVSDRNEWITEIIDGYQVLDIEEYFMMLLFSDRKKDRDRIPLVQEYIRNRK